MQVHDTVGAHILADFWGCDFDTLNDHESLVASLHEAAKVAGMTVLGEESHKFFPQGCTALLLLSESHISIHTYPEKGYAAIDVYTCGKGMTEKAMEFLRQALKPQATRIIQVRRGDPADVETNRHAVANFA